LCPFGQLVLDRGMHSCQVKVCKVGDVMRADRYEEPNPTLPIVGFSIQFLQVRFTLQLLYAAPSQFQGAFEARLF
jgi:hypothetical protein